MSDPESLPLTYEIIEPSTGSPPYPAAILLHGRGASEHDLLPLAEYLPDDLLILSVRAPDRLGPGYTWYELDLSNGGLHRSQPDSDDFDRSLSSLSTFVSEAIDRFDMDASRIGLLGFSQGAILGMSAMIAHERTYAWVVGLHGYLPARFDRPSIEAATHSPVFLGAGLDDDIIPATRVEAAADRLREGGVAVTFRTYPVGHTTSREELDDVLDWLSNIERSNSV